MYFWVPYVERVIKNYPPRNFIHLFDQERIDVDLSTIDKIVTAALTNLSKCCLACIVFFINFIMWIIDEVVLDVYCIISFTRYLFINFSRTSWDTSKQWSCNYTYTTIIPHVCTSSKNSAVMVPSLYLPQRNPQNVGTIGTISRVLIIEVSAFQGFIVCGNLNPV